MRRFFTSAFWLLVVATLVAPVPMGGAALASAPVCCLGTGEHHCLGHMLGSDLGLSASSKCPYSPLALAAMHGPELAPPVRAQLIAVVAQSTTIARESSFVAASLALTAFLERGPPAFSL